MGEKSVVIDNYREKKIFCGINNQEVSLFNLRCFSVTNKQKLHEMIK